MSSQRSLVLALACLTACSEAEPPCPVTNEAVQTIGELCAVTPSGLVLHSFGWTLVLERLSEDGTLEPLTQIQANNWRCGTVAEDPESDTIWLTVPGDNLDGDEVEPPDRLLTLDAEGNILGEETLEHEGAPIYIRSSFARAGELYLAGSVYAIDPDDYYQIAALLERRDGNGALLWRQVGYTGFNPGFDVTRDFHALGPIVGLDEDIAAFTSVFGTDSASIAMLTLRGSSGDVTWADVVTPDNYSGPHAKLGSDGLHTIFVSEEAQRIYDRDENSWERLGLLRSARSIVTAYSQFGWTNWRGEVTWPDLEDLSVTEAVGDAFFVVHVVSGADVDDATERRVSLVRQDWIGALDCTASLDDLGLWSVTSLHRLDDGRLLLGGRVEGAHENDEVLTQQAIVVLDVAPAPAPF
jgi:hypothetical protein